MKHSDPDRQASSNATKASSDKDKDKEKEKEHEKMATKTVQKPVETPKKTAQDTKKDVFSNDELAQMGTQLYELQDDKLRELCKTFMSSYNSHSEQSNNPKIVADCKKQVVQCELKVDICEAEYRATRKEMEEAREEKKRVLEKTKLVQEQIGPLLLKLEEVRLRRKERMEQESLALEVNRRKSQAELTKDVEKTDEQVNELQAAEDELERNKAIRYEALIRLNSEIIEMEDLIKRDFELLRT